MRFAGHACVVAVVAGIAALGIRDPTNAAPSASVPPPAPRVQATPPAPPQPLVVAQEARPPQQEPSQEAPSAARAADPRPAPAAPERRGGRQRFRNVWVGPIPTPADWAPPEGPVRIALQAGHWRADEAPAELSGLRDNGTSAQGRPEWEINLEIARRAGAQLEQMGYVVDILPAVVPPSYRAHLFISIHADGSRDPQASGFRVASPRNDATGRAASAARLLEQSYAQATGIKRLPTVTRRMQNYYAFNFRRYVHALHPMTIGVILETGFLTSVADRKVIVDDPGRAAHGIVAAVTAFAVTPPPAPAAASAAAGVE